MRHYSRSVKVLDAVLSIVGPAHRLHLLTVTIYVHFGTKFPVQAGQPTPIWLLVSKARGLTLNVTCATL
jgi:hypothetical protein